MGAVFFYHLTESALEQTLPPLLLRARGQGWRVELRGRDPARMDMLDRMLWLGPEDGFLPHGLAGGPHDALQPVLLTVDRPEGRAAANAPDCVMAVEGAALSPDEAGRLARGCILFDGLDGTAVEAARDQWRALTGAGIEAQYWAQGEGGGWTRRR